MVLVVYVLVECCHLAPISHHRPRLPCGKKFRAFFDFYLHRTRVVKKKKVYHLQSCENGEIAGLTRMSFQSSLVSTRHCLGHGCRIQRRIPKSMCVAIDCPPPFLSVAKVGRSTGTTNHRQLINCCTCCRTISTFRAQVVLNYAHKSFDPTLFPPLFCSMPIHPFVGTSPETQSLHPPPPLPVE
jgi:hypothetical protein